MGSTLFNLKRALSDAKHLLDQGLNDQAGEAFQRIAQVYPACAEAWFWLGVIGMNIGDCESAIVFLEQAHSLGLEDPACLSNLGEAYRRAGKLNLAENVLSEACRRYPDAYGALFNMATLHAEEKRFDSALPLIKRLTASHPNDFRLKVMMADVLKELGEWEEAEFALTWILSKTNNDIQFLIKRGDVRRLRGAYTDAMEDYQSVLKIDPDHVGAFNGLACVAVGLADEAGAEVFYREALKRSPDCLESLMGLGMELTSRHRFEPAIEVLRQAVEFHGDDEDAWMRLGEAYFYSDRFDEAMHSYKTALERNPDHAQSWTGVGNVCVHQQLWLDATEAYLKAYSIKPNDYRIGSNIAQAYLNMGNFENALRWAEGALSQIPVGAKLGDSEEDSVVRFNLSIVDLNIGNLDRGWANYDFRESLKRGQKRFPYPYWQGEALAGKRLLLWQDQGIGDQLVFMSLFEDLIAQAGEVVIECDQKLLALTRRSFPQAVVIPRRLEPHSLAQGAFDFQVAAGSLARWLRPTKGSFEASPTRFPLLRLDQSRCEYWSERLAELSPLPKLGICWRSSKRAGLRKICYAELFEWAPIFALPGVTLINLQYDECAFELDEIERDFSVRPVVFPELDMFNDLDESCALISQLDAVISAPTAVAWQAGAAGVQTSRLTTRADWLHLGQEIPPWMPHVISYRKVENDSWKTPLANIANDLVSRFKLQR